MRLDINLTTNSDQHVNSQNTESSESYKEYSSHYDVLVNHRLEAIRLYNHQINIVSIGSIAISLTYMLQKKTPVTRFELILFFISGVPLIASIMISIWSLYKSISLYDLMIDHHSRSYCADSESEGDLSQLNKEIDGRTRKLSRADSWQYWLFFVGLIVLVVFIISSQLLTYSDSSNKILSIPSCSSDSINTTTIR